jgi:hypothetical protein
MSAAATLFDADDDNLYDVTHVHHASLGRRLTAVVSALELGDVAGHGFHGNQYEKVGGEGKLPDSLYMATAEEGNLSWSASKIQTMRDQVDAVVPGLSKAVSRWGGSFRGTDLIQARSDLIMHGMDDKYPHFTDEDKRADADAQALMRGVEISGPTTKDLYRGINIPFDGTGHSGEYTVGQEVNFSLASFTERQKWADNFASGQMKLGAPAAGTPILFHLEKGSQALPIDAMRGLATSPENEWVSGGKFTVSSVEPYQLDPLMSDRQGLKVTLHQVDTVHP